MNNLVIDIPEDIKEQVSTIQLTPEFVAVIKVNEDIIESNIDFKKLGKQVILDWPKTVEKIMTKLKEKALDYQLLANIHHLLIKSSNTIHQYIDTIKDKGDAIKIESKNKRRIKIFKYYSEKNDRLYESVVINGKCSFISYQNEQVEIIEEIEESSRILVPFERNDTAVQPYEYKNKDQLLTHIKNSESLKIDQLYNKIKRIVAKYVDQSDHIISIITADIIFSYFQDRFPTTHYLFFLGDNNVGKSIIGDIFEQVAYRGVKLTNPSAPNIYRLIGKVQSAQCTLIIDEANDIDANRDLMNVCNTGYTINGKVAKINTATYEQEFFNTYCLKIFISEKLLDGSKAKGLLDRTFPITCLVGIPKESLKEVLVSNGKYGNIHIKELQEELSEIRNSLFAFRLVNASKRRKEIDMGLKNRDKELCEGIALFYGSSIQKEIEESFQILLDTRYKEKHDSFEAHLLTLIIQHIENDKTYVEISVEDLWNSIKNTTDNIFLTNNEIYLSDFDLKLFRNQLTNRCKIFGGESKRTNKRNKIIFKNIDKLKQFHDRYSNEDKPKIHCKIKDTDTENEDSGGSGGSGELDDEFIKDKVNSE